MTGMIIYLMNRIGLYKSATQEVLNGFVAAGYIITCRKNRLVAFVIINLVY
jgi:hypothetical protein